MQRRHGRIRRRARAVPAGRVEPGRRTARWAPCRRRRAPGADHRLHRRDRRRGGARRLDRIRRQRRHARRNRPLRERDPGDAQRLGRRAHLHRDRLFSVRRDVVPVERLRAVHGWSRLRERQRVHGRGVHAQQRAPEPARSCSSSPTPPTPRAIPIAGSAPAAATERITPSTPAQRRSAFAATPMFPGSPAHGATPDPSKLTDTSVLSSSPRAARPAPPASPSTTSGSTRGCPYLGDQESWIISITWPTTAFESCARIVAVIKDLHAPTRVDRGAVGSAAAVAARAE